MACTKTVTRTERLVVTNTDTLTLLARDTINNWPKPNDSSIVFLAFDTIPGFVLDSIVIQDINTDSVYNVQIEWHINGYIIRPLIPMYVCITFYYEWIEPNNVQIDMYTFDYTLGWTLFKKNPSHHIQEYTIQRIHLDMLILVKYLQSNSQTTKHNTMTKKQLRQANVVVRLQKQLKSGVKITPECKPGETVLLSDPDKKRITKEIETLRAVPEVSAFLTTNKLS